MVQTSKFDDDLILSPSEVQDVTPPSARITGSEEGRDDDDHVRTPEEEEEFRLTKASGIAGAILGLFLGGPIIAAIAGFGSAYAVRKQNSVGDKARYLGEVAISVGSKAQEVDERHAVSEKTKKVLGDVWSAVERVDQTRIASKTQEFAIKSWTDAVNYTREHRLIERGVGGTGRGFEYLSSKFSREEVPEGYESMPQEQAQQNDIPRDGTFY